MLRLLIKGQTDGPTARTVTFKNDQKIFEGVDKSTDQTAIIGKKIGDLIGDKYFRLLSPIIAVYNFIIKTKL